MLAIALLTNWPGTLRNDLADLRFAWQSRAATGDVVVVAIDAPSIEQIGVWPWPRRLHAELLQRLDARRHQRRRLRRRFLHAFRSGFRPRLRRGASPRRRIDRAAGLQAARRRWRHLFQPPAAAVPRPGLDLRRQRRDRARRSGAALQLRPEARRRVPALDGRRAGRALRRRQPVIPDRLQHPLRDDPEGLLHRRAARRCRRR